MDLQQNILNWLKSLKGWQTELAYRLLAKSNLEDADIDDIISMLKWGLIRRQSFSKSGNVFC